MTPRATYRLQLHEAFDFDAATAIVPYLAALGISHVYASPILAAHPGSRHGYDIVDHERLNPELGGLEGFARLSAALKAHGLRLILDIVPNHMGVGGADNAIWLDMLEWGREADHAGWFDVDWTPDRTDLRGKVLVPMLGDQYGAALQSGALRLIFDEREGSFAVWAHEAHKLPVCPTDYGRILGRDHPVLERLGDDFADALRWRPEIMARTRELKGRLARAAQGDAGVASAIADAVARFAGQEGDLESWARLDRLIGTQNWKATHFLVAADDINYRRFFNIATLAGLRMELPALFGHAHRLVFKLIAEDALHGLRIDHIDGLFDPTAYLHLLAREAPRLAGGSGPYVVVEKILGREERLRPDWPVAGTTGYEFTNLLTGLFVDGASETALTETYAAFATGSPRFADLVAPCKRQIVDDEMSSELHRLARAATGVARQNALTADFTLTVLQRALRQVVVAFPVYRTYIDGEAPPVLEDMGRLDAALAKAARHDPAIDASVFAFLRGLLSGKLVDGPRSGYRRADVMRCAMAFQQYCGPVMAKGVEDTAFYRAYRLVALNEVGGDPDRFGVPVEAFHAANAERLRDWPGAMLATSTHDTKRGEDTRARLVALSTMPEAWRDAVLRWSAVLRPAPAEGSPDRNDEYLVYQLLVGTLPPELLSNDEPAALSAYAERLKAVMTKSVREAKVHSTWTAPDADYEAGVLAFVDDALKGPHSAAFLELLRPVAERVARLGSANSFAQTVLKFTVPGMPDLYQGAELWDLTLVDPDNRRPIDYGLRRAVLEEASTGADAIRCWKRTPLDGRFKLGLTRTLLALRDEGARAVRRRVLRAARRVGSRAGRFRGVRAQARPRRSDRGGPPPAWFGGRDGRRVAGVGRWTTPRGCAERPHGGQRRDAAAWPDPGRAAGGGPGGGCRRTFSVKS